MHTCSVELSPLNRTKNILLPYIIQEKKFDQPALGKNVYSWVQSGAQKQVYVCALSMLERERRVRVTMFVVPLGCLSRTQCTNATHHSTANQNAPKDKYT